MPNNRDLQLDKYKISKNRYRELKYFCLQYEEKKKALSDLRGLKGVSYTGGSKSSKKTSVTESQALKAIEIQKDIELIEQTAIEADSSIYQQIIKNVTQGIQPEYMPMPCCKDYFYKKRRKFFCLLNLKK